MMKKRTAGRLAIALAAAAVLTGCAGAHTIDGSAEAVNVGGTSIPLGEVNFYLRYQQIYMQSMYGSLLGEDFMSSYGTTMRDSTLEALEEYYLVEANAEELGIALTDEEKTAASEAAQQFIAANDSGTLEAMTADEGTVTHVLELIALQQKTYDYFGTTIDTEVDPEEAAQKSISYVLSGTEGTTDDDGNTVELTEDELAQKRSDMEALLAEAKESGDLSAAAENYGLTVTSANYGKDDETLNASVYEAAEQLSDGEYSDVIEADNGYYVVYMNSTYDEEATQTEIQNILNQRQQDAYSAWIDPLKEAAEITVNEDQVSKLTFDRIYTVKAEDADAESTEEDAAAENSEDGAETSGTESEADAEAADEAGTASDDTGTSGTDAAGEDGADSAETEADAENGAAEEE